jgi:hypothetical protein
MNATEICEPTPFADQRKLWAVFVAGYTSMYQCSVVNVRPSHQILSLLLGVRVPQQSRDVDKVLHRTVKELMINSRSIITEEIFMTAAVLAPLKNEPDPDP